MFTSKKTQSFRQYWSYEGKNLKHRENFDNYSRVLLFSRRRQIALKVIDFGATPGSAYIVTRSRHLTQSNGAVVQTLGSFSNDDGNGNENVM